MAYDDFQYKLENLALYFRGGVRRSIIIFSVVLLILVIPIYYLGKLSSNFYAFSYLNLSPVAFNPSTDTEKYSIGRTQIAKLKNGENILYAAIQNKKNREVGFSPWNYSIQTFDKSGAVLGPKQSFSSYLLPDDNKYVVVKSSAEAVDMEILEESGTEELLYNPNANPLLTQPNVTVQNNSVTVDRENQTMRVYSLLRNQDSRFIKTIDLWYFVRDSQGAILFLGTSSMNGFVAGSDREFQVPNLPLPLNGDPKSVDVRWSVNYLTPGIMTL